MRFFLHDLHRTLVLKRFFLKCMHHTWYTVLWRPLIQAKTQAMSVSGIRFGFILLQNPRVHHILSFARRPWTEEQNFQPSRPVWGGALCNSHALGASPRLLPRHAQNENEDETEIDLPVSGVLPQGRTHTPNLRFNTHNTFPQYTKSISRTAFPPKLI